MFKFTEETRVAIKEDNLQLGMTAGQTGVIWALYETQPPAYEVTFRTRDGEEFDALMYEEELAEPTTKPAVAPGDFEADYSEGRSVPILAERRRQVLANSTGSFVDVDLP